MGRNELERAATSILCFSMDYDVCTRSRGNEVRPRSAGAAVEVFDEDSAYYSDHAARD